MRWTKLLLSALLVPALLAQTPLQEDGPYVLWEGRTAKVLRVVQGHSEDKALPQDRRLELPGLPPLRLDPALPKPAPDEVPMPPRLAAVSDAHGHFDSLTALLRSQGILGPGLTWAFGRGRLVVAGDCFDRGPQVTEILWFLRSLEVQARKAGGGVHVLLGNHEAMVLSGDLRYLNPKYQALPWRVPWLYGPDSEQGRWLRSLPVLLRVGDVLFAHGGVSPAFAAAHPDLKAVNREARAELGHGGGTILGPEGPLWYRGLAEDSGPAAADLAAVLATYGVRRIVVGHTTQTRITPRLGGLVTLIDAGLKDDQPGEVWIQEGGKRYRGLRDGSRVPLP
jgi:hypothetical protein